MSRVLLVVDVKGWAFWHMACGLAKYSRHQCTVLDNQEFDAAMQADERFLRRFAGVLQFSLSCARGPLPVRSAILLAHPGWLYPRRPGYMNDRLATEARNAVAADRVQRFDTVLVKNEQLRAGFAGRHPDVRRVRAGYDPQLYFPSPVPRESGGRLRIGWCGQVPGEGRRNQKGYAEVLEPLQRRLGETVEWSINTRNFHDPLDAEAMREWYWGLDLFLSTACAEGGPMPPLEALACGVPVLATDCGFLAELPIQTVPAWTTPHAARQCVDALEREIRTHLENRLPRPQAIPDWTWAAVAEEWLAWVDEPREEPNAES